MNRLRVLLDQAYLIVVRVLIRPTRWASYELKSNFTTSNFAVTGDERIRQQFKERGAGENLLGHRYRLWGHLGSENLDLSLGLESDVFMEDRGRQSMPS